MSGALPAWSLPATERERIEIAQEWPARVTPEWAFGGSTGAGTSVCILDSGIDRSHPLVGRVERSVAVVASDGGFDVVEDDEGDLCGHGTACAGIVHALAPECSLHSVRVLGAGYAGSGDVMLAGLRWAIEQRFDVVNMSLSTTKSKFAAALHELADSAYFGRTILCASAHNLPVESYPWRFSSVVSVGAHDEDDPRLLYANPTPPVEFFARGVEIDVAWPGGGTLRCTGNSFATPHVAGLCALALAKHRGLTPFQVKHLLYLTAANVSGGAA